MYWNEKSLKNNNNVLHDRMESGKEKPWRKHKMENISYSEYLDILKYRKAGNVKNCAETLVFKSGDTGHLKLYQAWFCKSRLCPLCSHRLAQKRSNQLKKVLDEAVKRESSGRFIFLTLTVKNVSDSIKLKSTLRQMGVAVHKMFKYKKIAKNVLGYVRSTEITVNREEGISYHPHMHLLLFVKPSYFKSSENYVPAKQWSKYWRKAMKLSYDPVVDVEIVKPNRKSGKGSKLAAAKETAKYQVKSDDYLTENEDENIQVIDDLEKGLSGSRAISYSGILKEIRHDLLLEDEEDLIHTDDEDDSSEDNLVDVIVATWDYKRKNYFTVKKQTPPLK